MLDLIVRYLIINPFDFKSGHYFISPLKYSNFQEILFSIIYITTAIPFTTIFSIAIITSGTHEYNAIFALVMGIKILRFWELKRFVNKVQNMFLYTSFSAIVFFKYVENFFYLILITHLTTCGWIFVNKVEINYFGFKFCYLDFQKTKPYYIVYGRKYKSELSNYIDSLMYAVGSMCGMNFGPSPQTSPEIAYSVIIMVVGAIFYGKVFADFDEIMKLLRKEKIEKNKHFEQAKEFCVERKLPIEIRRKVRQFYNDFEEGYTTSKFELT